MSTPPHPPTPAASIGRSGRIARWRAYGQALLAQVGLVLLLGLVVGLFSLVGFAWLAEEVAGSETLALDQAVLHWFQQHAAPGWDLAARIASGLGAEGVAGLLIVLVPVLIWRRHVLAAAGLVLTTIGAQLLNSVLKDLFHRTRPAPLSTMLPAQEFSFPSGHAMVAGACLLFLAYLSWRVFRGRWRGVVAGALLVMILLIGLSRLYLGVHYLTDVVAGYLAGFLWTDAVIVGWRLISPTGRATAPGQISRDRPERIPG